jgi:phage tail-like protein
MALSKEEMKRTYPLPAYNYRVEIGGTAVGFSKASGLDVSFETATYKESPTEPGKAGPLVMQMPAQRNPAKLTLEKGICASEGAVSLYGWINQTQMNLAEKRDVFVRLLDETGKAVVSWKVINAFPTKLTAPSFGADAKEIAIESMELVADAVFVERS